MARHHGNQNAGRPAADDQYVFVGHDPAATHIMAGQGNRLDQSRMVKRHALGQLVHCVGRHGPFLLEGTVGIEAGEFQVLADMGVAALAGRAFAAGVERPHHDAVSWGESGNAIADSSRHLVADHPFEADVLVHVAEINMQVGTADAAAEGDIDLHLTRPWWWGAAIVSTVKRLSPR